MHSSAALLSVSNIALYGFTLELFESPSHAEAEGYPDVFVGHVRHRPLFDNYRMRIAHKEMLVRRPQVKDDVTNMSLWGFFFVK